MTYLGAVYHPVLQNGEDLSRNPRLLSTLLWPNRIHVHPQTVRDNELDENLHVNFEKAVLILPSQAFDSEA